MSMLYDYDSDSDSDSDYHHANVPAYHNNMNNFNQRAVGNGRGDGSQAQRDAARINAKSNPWISYVREYAAKKNIPYSQAISEASASYKNAKKQGLIKSKGKTKVGLVYDPVKKIKNQVKKNVDFLLSLDYQKRANAKTPTYVSPKGLYLNPRIQHMPVNQKKKLAKWMYDEGYGM